MRSAAPRQQTLLNALPVSQQSHAVAGVERKLRQLHGRGAGMVQLGMGVIRATAHIQRSALRRSRAVAHQAAAVQNDPHRLAALGLVLAGDERAAARGGGPADVAQVVALAILAQALEIAAQAALARLAQLQVDLAAAREKYLLLFAGLERGVDTHGLLERRARPAVHEPQPGAIAQVEVARFPVAALVRLNGGAQRRGNARECGEPMRNERTSKLRWQVVGQAAIEHDAPFVQNAKLHLGGAVERGRTVPGAAGGQLRGLGQAQPIQQRGKQHQSIPGQHGVGQAAIPKAGNQQHEPGNQQQHGARRKAKAQPAPALARRADRFGME